ncbi:30S ribosomal protein S5 [Mycoplasma iguanae]|uniref:Small ribosomal subunit protein uS5 n=1 Tax=Mycoplasma iguanae TaxID=292461 RepID=A0ABY5R8M6_9MOLU|nr:30S ribosomal protein S5 [Mycoplasma iguanae]UVD81794.1 30S ribosomal protein S5 [Mycoplasma iguanae]
MEKDSQNQIKQSTTTVVSPKPNTEAKAPAANAERKPWVNKRPNSNGPRRQFNRNQQQSEYQEKVIDIARVTTVVKGGRRFSFSAFVVVGNKKGKVGFGHGKANEVQDAIKKAIKDAQNKVITVPIIKKSTVPHEITEKFLASKVLLKPAPKGKGIIASGTVRAVVELAGYTDIYTKTYGSRTKANIVYATINALKKLRTAEEIAKLRDIELSKLVD